MNSEKNRISKWEIKDVITVILLSLFLIVIQFLINMVCMINHFTSMVLSIGFTMLLCAPVYYLLLCRVRRPWDAKPALKSEPPAFSEQHD